MNISHKIYLDASNVLNDTADAMLGMDVKNIGAEIHYNDQDIMNTLLIFNHVLSNRMIHNMIKKQSSIELGENKAVEIGEKLRQLVIDMTGIDPHTFYSDKKPLQDK